MRRLLIALFSAVCVIAPSHAQIGAGPAAAAARAEAEQWGTPRVPALKGNVTGGSPSTTVPGFTGQGQPQTQYFQGGMGDVTTPGSARAFACEGQSDLECQAIQLLMNSRTTRPQFDIGPNDPLVGLNRGRTQNPTSITGDLFSTYETCRTVTTVNEPILENKVCEDFSKLETTTCKIGMDVVVDADHLYKCMERLMSQYNASCTYGRVIVVDKDYIYQCTQSPRKLETLSCNRTLTVTCTAGGDGCSPSGVVPGTTQGDMSISFNHAGGGTWTLIFGRLENNTWETSNPYNVKDRSMTFQLSGLDNLTEFRLAYTRYDDWIWIRVNGRTAFVGPKAMDHPDYADRLIEKETCVEMDWGLRCTSVVQYNEAGNTAAFNQRQKLWEAWPGVDVRPWLVEGLNTVDVRVMHDTRGEAGVQFSVRAKCPSTCTDTWANGCASLESRSR